MEKSKEDTIAALNEAGHHIAEALRLADGVLMHSPHITDRFREYLNRKIETALYGYGCTAIAREIEEGQ